MCHHGLTALLWVAAVLFGSSVHAAAAVQALRAGAGKAEIVLPPLPLQGGTFTSQHDPLECKVVLLDNSVTRVALVTIDMTSLSADMIDLIQKAVGEVAKVSPANVLVSATHTFSAPHVPGAQQTIQNNERQLMIDALTAAVRKSSLAAFNTLQSASVGASTGASYININRDLEVREGWSLGANEQGSSDKSVGVVRIDNQQGEPIVILVNYAVQASVMNESTGPDGGRVITADLAGATTRYIERQYGEKVVSLFLVGAAGDQSPTYVANRYTIDKDLKSGRVDVGNAGFLLVDLLGERLGAEAVRVAQSIRPVSTTMPVRVVQNSMMFMELESSPSPTARQPRRKHEYVTKDKAPMPYWIMQVGDIAFVGVQVELASTTGTAIKAQSPFRHTMVLSMVNGAAKYLPDAESFDRITYEALGARYARGSAETFTTGLVQELQRMKSDAGAM